MVIMTCTKRVVITEHMTLKGHITLVPLIRTKLKVIHMITKVIRRTKSKVIRRTRLIPLTEHTKLKVIPRTKPKVLVERIEPKVIGHIELKVVKRTELKVIGRIRLAIRRPLTKVSGQFVSQLPDIQLSLGLSLKEYTLHICPRKLGERIRSNTLLHNSL
jgi:hypothetical protein